MLTVGFYLFVLVYFIRTISFAIHCKKQKQGHFMPLLLLAFCLLFSPLLALWMDKL